MSALWVDALIATLARCGPSEERPPMERRSFLKGVFGGITAAGVIVAASPREIAAFASPLVREAPLVLDAPAPEVTTPGAGEYLYNERGERVAIIRELSYGYDLVETTTWGANNRTYASGRPRLSTIIAEGLGRVERAGNRFELRAVPHAKV